MNQWGGKEGGHKSCFTDATAAAGSQRAAGSSVSSHTPGAGPHLESTEQIDLHHLTVLLEQRPYLIFTGRAQHFGKKQLQAHKVWHTCTVSQKTFQKASNTNCWLYSTAAPCSPLLRLIMQFKSAPATAPGGSDDRGHAGGLYTTHNARRQAGGLTANTAKTAQQLQGSWVHCAPLTILFSALLSSTARRFLICSSGSAHFTARGVALPSSSCFSSMAAMAYHQAAGSSSTQATQQDVYQGRYLKIKTRNTVNIWTVLNLET